MDFKDYYKILGVDNKAELKAIKVAYRRLARKYHPDVSTESDAENQFKAIAEAYAVLKDKGKRAEYDAIYEQAKYGQHESFQHANNTRNEANQYDFSDFFESVFNQSQKSHRRDNVYREAKVNTGQDLEMAFAISLEEAVFGGDKTIAFKLPTEKKPKKLKVKIPSQTQIGDQIRLKGQGMSGVSGTQAGDIYLRVDYEPHDYFDVVGLDLILTVPISPWEAALGAKIIIPTLSSQLSLTIPPNSQTGNKLRIKNKGLQNKQRSGDLFAILKVMMPDKNNSEINLMWKSMAEKFNFNPRSKWSQ